MCRLHSKKEKVNFKNAVETKKTVYCNKKQVKVYTFETFMQRLKLTFSYGTKEVSNKDGKNLPCPLLEGICAATTPDLFAYTWRTPEKGVMTKVLTEEAKLLMYLSTADQNKKVVLNSEINDTKKWCENENR